MQIKRRRSTLYCEGSSALCILYSMTPSTTTSMTAQQRWILLSSAFHLLESLCACVSVFPTLWFVHVRSMCVGGTCNMLLNLLYCQASSLLCSLLVTFMNFVVDCCQLMVSLLHLSKFDFVLCFADSSWTYRSGLKGLCLQSRKQPCGIVAKANQQTPLKTDKTNREWVGFTPPPGRPPQQLLDALELAGAPGHQLHQGCSHLRR